MYMALSDTTIRQARASGTEMRTMSSPLLAPLSKRPSLVIGVNNEARYLETIQIVRCTNSSVVACTGALPASTYSTRYTPAKFGAVISNL